MCSCSLSFLRCIKLSPWNNIPSIVHFLKYNLLQMHFLLFPLAIPFFCLCFWCVIWYLLGKGFQAFCFVYFFSLSFWALRVYCLLLVILHLFFSSVTLPLFSGSINTCGVCYQFDDNDSCDLAVFVPVFVTFLVTVAWCFSVNWGKFSPSFLQASFPCPSLTCLSKVPSLEYFYHILNHIC